MPSDKSHSHTLSIEELLELFRTSTTRKRRTLITSIEKRYEELIALKSRCIDSFTSNGDDWAAGWILQVINRHQPDHLKTLFDDNSGGWFECDSACDINYAPLQKSLIEEKFEDADRLTTAFLRKLAGPGAEDRGYVYFSEVPPMSSIDLTTLDRLWCIYSQGRFGFSVQGRLLNSLGGRYEMLWPRIGWKNDGIWTRYPGSFDWSITAPEGHMPLVNQLRGVRLMNELLTHPAIYSRN